MLTIICGEDTVLSRKYFTDLKIEYSKKEYEVQEILASQIQNLLKWQGENLNLFASKTVFFTDHLDSLIIKKRGKKSTKPLPVLTLEAVCEIVSKKKDISLIVWEEKAQRDLKLKTIAQVKEFKPSSSIFKLLELCKPGSLKQFIQMLRVVLDSQDPMFVFIMLTRHIKTLILAREDIFSPIVQSWQRYKLADQAKLWKGEKLTQFYEGLYKIEVSTKSGTNPYGMKNSLEILACFHL